MRYVNAICPIGRDMHGYAVRKWQYTQNVAKGDISHVKYIAAKPYSTSESSYIAFCEWQKIKMGET